ncbi:NfeD family protein [Quadrisphaera sp. DSM 44207]|uniref:NfeD family protein n=1 Tax=Quadrisphaera sp. DSM 44207 TaxID=1881057 RepID=UPI0008827EF1|nr:NfeD family protein [Quadrisphaera sp. DSM 44207]SDQ43175.1 Membrane protein implicated in regulation of membrane protease activity [Quadrisphaera sp. DSM 44207]
MSWHWWVVAAFVLGGLEVFTLDLVFGTLVVAALAGAVASAAGLGFPGQALVVAATAVLMLAVVRPLLVRRLKVEGALVPSGTAAHVGRPARVLAEVTELGGRVKLAGEEWSARSAAPGRAFAAGEPVRVVAIDGATAVVDAPPAAPPGGSSGAPPAASTPPEP